MDILPSVQFFPNPNCDLRFSTGSYVAITVLRVRTSELDSREKQNANGIASLNALICSGTTVFYSIIANSCTYGSYAESNPVDAEPKANVVANQSINRKQHLHVPYGLQYVLKCCTV